ncbi:MAG: iron-containing alcohol dehydrogenase [Firmicutes bacterium]|nr:iron-containing alcohol dehydrogenase [Bacillota bacterium]
MNDFTFQNPTKVLFGRNQLEHLPEELKNFGTRVLMVYGGGSIKRNGLYDKLMGLMTGAGLTVFELPGVEPNPRHTTVNKGVAICRENDVEVILAVGGGSTIDCAKGIAATTLSSSDNVWDLVEHKVSYTEALPIVTVVTIAATGSEMDTGAVISNMDLNIKSGIGSPICRPKVTFEDPELTFTVPAYQTACGSFDIMSHIFDVAYFSNQPQMDMLERIQEEVLKTVVKYAPVAIAEPDNYEARANLMWASSWALNDFLYCGVRQMTACHAMEHELSAYYDITHGLGLAILTPRWLAYILDENTAPKIRQFGVRVMGIEATDDVMSDARKAIDALADFCFKTLGLESHLSSLGIGEENFEKMAQAACRGGELYSFKNLKKEDIVNIYRMCL